MEIELWLIWLILAVVMLIVEVATLTMMVALSGGRMYCLDGLCLCGAGMSVQLVALPARQCYSLSVACAVVPAQENVCAEER